MLPPTDGVTERSIIFAMESPIPAAMSRLLSNIAKPSCSPTVPVSAAWSEYSAGSVKLATDEIPCNFLSPLS